MRAERGAVAAFVAQGISVASTWVSETIGWTATNALRADLAALLKDNNPYVRGRAAYSRMQMVVPRPDADTLLTLLRERFATSRVLFWMVPAIASGRLA